MAKNVSYTRFAALKVQNARRLVSKPSINTHRRSIFFMATDLLSANTPADENFRVRAGAEQLVALLDVVARECRAHEERGVAFDRLEHPRAADRLHHVRGDGDAVWRPTRWRAAPKEVRRPRISTARCFRAYSNVYNLFIHFYRNFYSYFCIQSFCTYGKKM